MAVSFPVRGPGLFGGPDYPHVWRVLRWLDTVPGAAAGSWFEFYGQAHSPPFAQIGIIPWTWSEVLLLLIHHLAGIRPGLDRLCLRPRLLPGLERIQITIPLRDFLLHLTVQPGERRQTFFCTDAPVLKTDAEQLEIAYPGRDISVEAEVCYRT